MWDQPFNKHSSSMESPHDMIANTSGSSSVSEVLRRSSAPHGSQFEQHGKHNSSDASSSANSSISSSSSMRVRIKAKLLRERRSPFETGGSSSTPYLPPALPGNLPVGYDVQRDVADVQRHTITEDVTLAKGEDDDSPVSPVLTSVEDHEHDGHKQVSNTVPTNSLEGGISKIQRQSLSTGHHGHGDHSHVAVHDSKTIPTVTQLHRSSLASVDNIHKKKSGILSQGAPTSSSVPFQSATWGQPMDVRVTQYSKGQRQQVMRDQLLKRSENSKPTKRYYQPKFIASARPSASKPETSTAQSEAGAMATATAAAAAAVAATVPLLKSDLESKMNHIMEKLSVLEHVGHGPPPPPPWVYPMGPGWGGGGYDARHDLGEMTQRRLGELEELQRQQRDMQTELRALSQRNTDRGAEVSNRIPPHSTHTLSDHLVSPGVSQARTKEPRPDNELPQKKVEDKSLHEQPGTNPKTSSRSPTPKACLDTKSGEPPKPVKHVRYTPAVTVHRLPQGQVSSGGQQRGVQPVGVREHHGTQTSPLETPAPRRHAPRPHSKEIRATGISQIGRGLLEEILLSHDEDERTRDLRQQVQPSHVSALNVNSSNSRYVFQSVNALCMMSVSYGLVNVARGQFYGNGVTQNY